MSYASLHSGLLSTNKVPSFLSFFVLVYAISGEYYIGFDFFVTNVGSDTQMMGQLEAETNVPWKEDREENTKDKEEVVPPSRKTKKGKDMMEDSSSKNGTKSWAYWIEDVGNPRLLYVSVVPKGFVEENGRGWTEGNRDMRNGLKLEYE
ncbi:hypothetical protein AKJ16_DCAP06813 [Drosera capensis]